MTPDPETIRQALQCGQPGCICGQPRGNVHCPAHDDKTPSLSVSQTNGQVLVKCFGGCSQAAVIDALKARDLWPSSNGNQAQAQKPRIVATYDYLDAAGKLVFQVVRREPKDFRQRRPDGKGGWIWNLQGVARVPYRLPDLLQAEGVAIVEGEKDADALTALGVVATTCPGGAGKWRREFNQLFQGKKVVILPDNDDPGRAHAQQVALNLHGMAAAVKVVELPGLPDKGDVCDWIAAGGTFEQLSELVKAAPEWKPKLPSNAPGACSAPQAEKEPTPPPAPLQWPEEVMTGAAGLFARGYAKYLETPESFLFMAYLTYLGHLISDRVTLQSEITPQPRLFTILLGESADVRKTTSISKTHGFFKSVISADDLNTIWGVGSAEGLAKCFKKNNRAILILDELKSLIQKMRIDASVLLPCINTLFETKHFHSITKKQGITIDDAELCLLAASTLETYYNMFNATFLDIGFLNRLFIVIGDSKRKFSIPDSMPQDEKESLKSDLKEVLSFVGGISDGGQYAMPIEAGAKEIFDAWYFGLEQSSFAKRLDTYGHRLMPLLAVNEMRPTITPGIAQKTVAMLNYQLAARKFADPIDADNAIAKLEEKIRRLLAGGPLPKRELERRGNKARVGIWAWDQAIKNLRNSGEISWDSRTKEFRRNG